MRVWREKVKFRRNNSGSLRDSYSLFGFGSMESEKAEYVRMEFPRKTSYTGLHSHSRSSLSIKGFKYLLSSIGHVSVYTSHNKKVWRRKNGLNLRVPSSFQPLISGGRGWMDRAVVAMLVLVALQDLSYYFGNIKLPIKYSVQNHYVATSIIAKCIAFLWRTMSHWHLAFGNFKASSHV